MLINAGIINNSTINSNNLSYEENQSINITEELKKLQEENNEIKEKMYELIEVTNQIKKENSHLK